MPSLPYVCSFLEHKCILIRVFLKYSVLIGWMSAILRNILPKIKWHQMSAWVWYDVQTANSDYFNRWFVKASKNYFRYIIMKIFHCFRFIFVRNMKWAGLVVWWAEWNQFPENHWSGGSVLLCSQALVVHSKWSGRLTYMSFIYKKWGSDFGIFNSQRFLKPQFL